VDGIDKVINSEGTFALLAESPGIEYLLERRCGFVKIGHPLSSIAYGFAIQKGTCQLS